MPRIGYREKLETQNTHTTREQDPFVTTVERHASRGTDFVASREIRVLVVDEEQPLTDVLTISLRFEGWHVTTASSGEAAIAAATAESFDAILLDMMLPDVTGTTVVAALRARGVTSPVIFLTGRDSLEDRLAAFGAGGDDYITKPFGLDEVASRLIGVFRRLGLGQASLVYGDLVVDPQSGQAWRAGEQLMLSAVEIELLRALVTGWGRVHGLDELIGDLREWGYTLSPAQATRALETLAAVVDSDRVPLVHDTEDDGWFLGAL